MDMEKETEMNFDEYQLEASEFAQYGSARYPFFGLAEEVGEFLGLAAKVERGDDLLKRFGSKEAVTEAFMKEAGDVLWQLSQCLNELGMSLQEVAEMNLYKLRDRMSRGVIKGSGDDR